MQYFIYSVYHESYNMLSGHKPDLAHMITGFIWATLLPPIIGSHGVCRDPYCAITATHGPALAERVHLEHTLTGK